MLVVGWLAVVELEGGRPLMLLLLPAMGRRLTLSLFSLTVVLFTFVTDTYISHLFDLTLIFHTFVPNTFISYFYHSLVFHILSLLFSTLLFGTSIFMILTEGYGREVVCEVLTARLCDSQIDHPKFVNSVYLCER